MNEILNRIQNLLINRVHTKLERLKHRRGDHDQREHGNWSRGAGMHGGNVYVPTGKRLIAMNQMQNIRQNVFGSDFTFYNKNVQLSEERNNSRLPSRLDISPYVGKMSTVSDGASGVQTFEIDGKRYFYRRAPIYAASYRGPGNPDKRISTSQLEKYWFSMPSYYMPLIADSLSTAMGLNVAPVAQMTEQGRMITNGMNFQKVSADQKINQLKKQYLENKTEENYKEYIDALEPHIVMSLLTGNVDIKPDNLSVVDDKISSVDYDYAGGNARVTGKWEEKEPILQDYVSILLNKEPPNNSFLSTEMRSTLEGIQQGGIQWNENISDFARQQMMTRINSLLEIDNSFGETIQRFQDDNESNNSKAVDNVVDEFTGKLENDSLQELNAQPLQKDARADALNLQNWANKIQKLLFVYFKQNFDYLKRKVGTERAEQIVEEIFGIDYNSLVSSTDALQKELVDSTTGFYKTNSAVSAENFLQQSQQLEQQIQQNPLVLNSDRFHQTIRRYM
jgi:hypothetical protein